MAKQETIKFAPEIDAKLYQEFVSVAKRNGRTQRYVLEEALRHYLRNVVPSQHLARREVMESFEESVARNRDLNERIAFVATDVFLRGNGFYLKVGAKEGYEFIDGSISRGQFRFAPILDWTRQHIKPLKK